MRVRLKTIASLFSLILVDLLAYYVSVFCAVFFRQNFRALFNFKYIFSQENASLFIYSFYYMASIWWMPVAFIIVQQFEKLYMARYPFWEETRVILKSATVSIVFMLLTITVRNMYGSIPRSVFVFLWFFLIIIVSFLRYWGKRFFYRIGIWKEQVLIIGIGENAIAAVEGLEKERHLGYKVIGFLEESGKRIKEIKIKNKNYRVYQGIKNISKFVNLLKIDTVFIANPTSEQEKMTEMINEIYKYVKRVIIIPNIKGIAIFNSELHYLFMEKLFLIKINNNLNSTPNIIIKRAFDIFFSLFIMVLILPLFLLLMLLVKLDSEGPIFYTQKRVGKNGREFKIIKFRTMYKDSSVRLKNILKKDPKVRLEWEKNFKLKNDPRVTPVGRFLRKTSLDELPQIINVLRGEMSWVGPRPVVRQEIEKYYGSYKQYYYSVYPGLAGLWQVSGRSDTDYDFRIQTDAWYVQNWSLWLDLIILFKAVFVVLKREGAY